MIEETAFTITDPSFPHLTRYIVYLSSSSLDLYLSIEIKMSSMIMRKYLRERDLAMLVKQDETQDYNKIACTVTNVAKR
jgi:hypothetical protein